MSDTRTTTMVVTLPDGSDADWSRIGQILAWHRHPAFVPHPVLPVRTGGLPVPLRHLAGTRPRHGLLDVVRHDRVARTAGGQIRRLDLHAHATGARIDAARRWWTWHELIARSTPAGKPWEHFLGEHLADPAKCSRPEARRRFQAQPRVLAMLAYNSYPAAAHHLDPLHLAEYQAGEAVYVALHWQHSLTGDALVDRSGRLLRPETPTIADRLRYLADASRIVNQLGPHDWLTVVRAAALP